MTPVNHTFWWRRRLLQVLVTKTSETRVTDVNQQNWRLQDISKTFWKLNANVFDVFNLKRFWSDAHVLCKERLGHIQESLAHVFKTSLLQIHMFYIVLNTVWTPNKDIIVFGLPSRLKHELKRYKTFPCKGFARYHDLKTRCKRVWRPLLEWRTRLG